MPAPTSNKAPSFEGEIAEPIDFLEYPDAEEDIKYTHRNLELIVVSPSNDGISTETKLLQHYRKFRPVAVWLITNKKISVYERDLYFWEGLPVNVRRAIDRRLQLAKKDYSRDEPPNYEEVVEAGRFVLSDNAFDADPDDLISIRLKSLREERMDRASEKQSRNTRIFITESDEEESFETRKKDAPRGVHTERVSFNPNVLSKSQWDEVEELARKMHFLDITDASYSASYTRLVCLAPAAAHGWVPPSSRQFERTVQRPTAMPQRSHLTNPAPIRCCTCGGPHLLRECLTVNEYIRTGQIVRINGYLAFPDGSRIRRHRITGNLKDMIDESYTSMKSNLITVRHK